jgi:hypothetical protein
MPDDMIMHCIPSPDAVNIVVAGGETEYGWMTNASPTAVVSIDQWR